VQSVKNDKIIVNELSEAIILGKVSTYVNFWVTTPGIVTIITTIVGILSILANLYLLNKIRYLLIAVAVLKTAILKTNANTLNLNFQDHSGMDQNENDKIWHEIITEWAREINLQHVSIFLLVLIMSVVFAIVYKLWCKKNQINFKFAIEIVSQDTYYYVNLCTLSGSMDDYVVTASEFIKNIKIEGCFRPTLNFKWKNLTICNQVTQVKTKITRGIPVSWCEKQKLTRLFQKDFKINPVFEKNGQIMRIMIKQQIE